MIHSGTAGFFGRRWRGEVALGTLFWRDMLLIGTAVNVCATIVALIAVASGAPPLAGLLLHFAPLPYNLFLFAAITRKAAPPLTLIAAALWLMLSMLL